MNYRSFPEIFEERVALEPSALAVRDNMLALTYRDLNTRSNEIALYLQSKGVRRGDRVGVLMTRSIKAIAAIIGILKVGAAYVPLDAQDPYPRLKQILAEVDPVLLFTDTETKHSFPDRRLVCFDEMELGQALQGVGNLQLRPKPDDLAYVIYTSGSTGDAKGIAGVHSSITSGMAWVPKDPIREGEVWGLNVSLTFGASIARLFLPLMCGIPLVVFTDEVTKDAQRLLKAVFAERVTNLFLVAPLLQEILRAGQPLTDLLAHVRTVVTGGADRPRNLWQLVNDRIPHIRVIDGYAASEVGSPIIVSMYDWTSKSVVDRIFPGITVRLLDADMKQVPIGGEGEVYVAGQHLARGYWNDLQLTSERFVTLQIEDSPQRLFRTGDRARRTAEDSFELLGRTDLVVKIRGYRV
ncbi:MAG TPA: AMP-binding protein, partial [Terriglobia bacterium]|nr:AMP-binding protein [Terriglobia bacterium]